MRGKNARLTLLVVALGIVVLIMVFDAAALVQGTTVQPRIVTSTATFTFGGGTGSRTTIVIPYFTGQGWGNFDPDNVTVVVGVNNTITWINEDQTAEHDILFDTWPAGANVPGYPSDPIPYGGGYTITLTTPGIYSYECEFHYWMYGTIIVKA